MENKINKLDVSTGGRHTRRFPATRTKRANFERKLHRGALAPSELAVIALVGERKEVTLREMANELFGGDYLKAKNAVRRPRGDGGLPAFIVRAKQPGTYKPGRALES